MSRRSSKVATVKITEDSAWFFVRGSRRRGVRTFENEDTRSRTAATLYLASLNVYEVPLLTDSHQSR